MKTDKPKVYVRSANNSWGEKMTLCQKGEFNLSLDENNKLWLHIYYRDHEILKMHCYKTPYHIATGILSAKNPIAMAQIVKDYVAEGLVPGKDFTVTINGVYLKIKERFTDYLDDLYKEDE